MAHFSESLTIRILGDSSHLQRELEGVRMHFAGLERELSRFGEINARLEQTGARIGALSRPLGNVSRLLDRVAGQAAGLGRIPITLNVAPAIGALNVLLSVLNVVAARMAAISFGSMMVGFGGAMAGGFWWVWGVVWVCGGGGPGWRGEEWCGGRRAAIACRPC
jgi:hypothetical protein